jgi:ribonuclease VapC
MSRVVVVDASALVAILLKEPSWQLLQASLAPCPVRLVPASSMIECGMVLSRKIGSSQADVLERMRHGLNLRVVPLDEQHARAAVEAWNAFGKGSGHRARLNFGDCCTYATAKVAGAPLLHVGNNFNQTDLAIIAW